eukprot:UN05734
MIKYSVLYSLSIFSCCVLIILSYNLPFGYNYSIIDGFINGIILILLHPIHNKLYKNSVCCCLHWLCIIILDALSDDHEPEIIRNKNVLKQMQIGVTNVCQQSPTLSPVQQNDNLELSTMVACSPITMATTPDPVILGSLAIGWKENDEPPTPIPSMCSDCNDNIIMTEIEIDRLTLKDVFSISSFKSGDHESFKTNNSAEFDRKRSNTLKLINYESTKL